jgi:hypothetical protein
MSETKAAKKPNPALMKPLQPSTELMIFTKVV